MSYFDEHQVAASGSCNLLYRVLTTLIAKMDVHEFQTFVKGPVAGQQRSGCILE